MLVPLCTFVQTVCNSLILRSSQFMVQDLKIPIQIYHLQSLKTFTEIFMEANSLCYIPNKPQLLQCRSNCSLFSNLHNRMASIKISVTSQYYSIIWYKNLKRKILKCNSIWWSNCGLYLLNYVQFETCHTALWKQMVLSKHVLLLLSHLLMLVKALLLLFC